MAMRMDPPEPPPPVEYDTVWWTRSSADAERGGRTLYAKVSALLPPFAKLLGGRQARILVEYYGELTIGPGLVQRYSSRETAEQVLERQGWVRAVAAPR